jgi:hypothetical protein
MTLFVIYQGGKIVAGLPEAFTKLKSTWAKYGKQIPAIDNEIAALEKEVASIKSVMVWRTAAEMRDDVITWARNYRETITSITQRKNFSKACVASYRKSDGTIETVFGRNGGILETQKSYPTISAEKKLGLHPDLAKRLPENTQWPNPANCAECDAVNQALYNGAKWEEIQIHTIDVRPDGAMKDVIRCEECQDIFKKMYVTSE